MVAVVATLRVHQPGDWQELLVLVCVVLVGFVFGARTVGLGFALVSAGLGVLAFIIVGNVAIPAAIALAAVALAMRAALTGTTMRREGGPYAVEALVILAGLLLYSIGRSVSEGSVDVANANTAAVIDFERGLGLFFEPDLQSWIRGSDTATQFMNWVYSFAFLAIIGWILVWLWVTDVANYRLLRTCMGLSALIAIPTMMLFPVAPPRLAPEAGMVDTIALFGRDHAFVNEFAAIPSLHVGWMAIAGFALGRSVGGRAGMLIALALGPLMLINVVATGNHFWVDGAIGSAFALGAAALVLWHEKLGMANLGTRVRAAGSNVTAAAQTTWATLGENRRALFSFLSLGALLAYLVVAQAVTPGFTDFWGYLVVQVGVFVVLLVGCEVYFAKEGGLSWITHVIAVACAYADVLGTDGNLYAAIDEYDKLTHFFGVAAIAAGLYDILRALYRRGTVRWQPNDRLMLSVAIAVAVGIAWEGYELVGDKVFNTTRVGGRWDTGNDIVSDSLGAIVFAALLWWMETRAPAPAHMEAPSPAVETADAS